MDPKLAQAMEEIRAVLRKHDTPGVIFLTSQTHTDFIIEMEASWTCARVQPGGFLRVRCKRADYPSAEAQKAELTRTVSAMLGFADAMRGVADKLIGLVAAMDIDLDHWSREEPP